ncbi:aerobic-type carbon monoxide dehydrogenase [Clostridium sp. SY8519]|uniref:molybdopterin-dependent oxidoreductase n=1 Tax=Clostridium sp. (strain SY8519) TaxID=1042156 RepID=UPI0002171BA5|nr:molybdopterin cofactor-binding domain-containing protein [Clostridium sp. SY8519]BAK46452.1 aerobic-type carbon monoxide dehydrogenase [Clostridium sp. SY8519]
MGNVSRKSLVINGVFRHVVYDGSKDSLAQVLRRFGLTGTKIGCDKGICGACSVIMNGKLVRSCNIKMTKVPEFSEILTIEGIGTPDNLHPLQLAWITHGGAQCGFCTPGFIVSSYALLSENPSPTREEVRDWFEKNHNVCRCTGYVQLVDAVMDAAAVMRGEKTMDDITWKLEEGEEYYGSNMPRPSAIAKVCGLTDFGDDIAMKMPGTVAFLAPVMAGIPHAKILSIDTTEALAVPGVIKVLTAADVKGSNDISFPAVVPRQKGQGSPKFPLICDEVVNRRGDVVAIVAAVSQEIAREAAKKVRVEWEILPSYMSILESFQPDALQLHKNVPNQYLYAPLYKGEDTEEIFEDAPIVVEGSWHTQHQPHMTIEPDVFQGYWDEDGMLTIMSKTHDLYGCRDELAPAIGLDPEMIRMIDNPAGGCFGYSTISSIFALAGVAVMALNMPVSMTLTYEEHMHMTGKRSATYCNGRLACDEDGMIQGVEFDVAMDHGAYAGTSSIAFGNLISVPFQGYNIPNVKALGRAGTSNHAFTCAYRGFGGPQIYTTSEALTDMAAEQAGIDPWEFRMKNAAHPGDLTINSRPYLSYTFPQLLNLIKPHYDEFKAIADAAKKEGRHVGVGVSMGGFNVGKGFIDHCEDDLELCANGYINVYNTWQDLGQGADIGTLTHVLKCLEPLHITPDKVRQVVNDTKLAPDSGLSAASRSHFMNGRALIDAAEKLLNAMRKEDGTYRTYEEMIAESIPTRYRGHVDEAGKGYDPAQDPNTGEGNRFAAYTYGAFCSLVEVDVNTGKTTVLKYAGAVDCGKIGNKLSVDGQAYGGISHGIGFALSEDYDASDRANNIAYCGVPTCKVIPDDIRIEYYEDNPRPQGPHGSSGCSEVFQACTHMPIINAINNACGVRIYDLPATPAKVKAAWEKLQNGEDLTPPKYYFGSEFEDELEYIRENPI